MNRVRLAAAGFAVLLTAACGGPYSDAAQVDQLTVRPSSSTARATEPSAVPPNTRMLGDGLTVTVSRPKSFTPTDAAYPRSRRAVAVELVINNEGKTVYRPAQLSVTAVCNGVKVAQVVDSTQGYTGFVGATEDVPPGESMRVVVAFAVPEERSEFRLMVQPDAVDGGRVTVYEGAV